MHVGTTTIVRDWLQTESSCLVKLVVTFSCPFLNEHSGNRCGLNIRFTKIGNNPTWWYYVIFSNFYWHSFHDLWWYNLASQLRDENGLIYVQMMIWDPNTSIHVHIYIYIHIFHGQERLPIHNESFHPTVRHSPTETQRHQYIK